MAPYLEALVEFAEKQPLPPGLAIARLRNNAEKSLMIMLLGTCTPPPMVHVPRRSSGIVPVNLNEYWRVRVRPEGLERAGKQLTASQWLSPKRCASQNGTRAIMDAGGKYHALRMQTFARPNHCQCRQRALARNGLEAQRCVDFELAREDEPVISCKPWREHAGLDEGQERGGHATRKVI